MKARIALLLALFLLLVATLPALAQGDSAAALDWLQEQVREDGGFSDGFSDASGVSPTTEALFAAVAAGSDISTWGADASPLDYLTANAASVEGTGTLAKLLLSAVATGQDPTDFGGVNLVEQLQNQYDSSSGTFEGIVTEHAYAMLALHAAGEEIPAEAATALKALQAEQGGWSFDGTSQPDTNSTALAIQALVAAGEPVDSTDVVVALAFLKSQQNEDGGFPYQAPSDVGTDSDANSTAWAIQALLAAEQPLDDWNDPQQFLASLQMENGAFQWQETVEGANFLATAQAIPALEGVTYVNLPVVEAEEQTAQEGDEAAEGEGEPEALPETGHPLPWAAVAALGLLLLLAGATFRRAFP